MKKIKKIVLQVKNQKPTNNVVLSLTQVKGGVHERTQKARRKREKQDFQQDLKKHANYLE